MSNNKDWEGTQNSLFKMLGVSNHCKDETDPVAIDWLLKYEKFDQFIWEPACGQMHLSNRLKELGGHKVYSTDLINRGCDGFNGCVDFLKYDGPIFQGDIITNAP